MGSKTISPCSSEVWSDWGTNQIYTCPELIYYELKMSKYVSFKQGYITRLWDKELKSSLDNPVMTSLITELVMYDDSPVNLANLKELYGLQSDSDFKTLFDIFRFMT